MFECSLCAVWSHTDCVYGTKVSNETLKELEVIFHNKHRNIADLIILSLI